MRHDLELGAELGRAQLDHLTIGQHFLVGDVEDRAGAAFRMFDAEHDRGRAVLGDSSGGAA